MALPERLLLVEDDVHLQDLLETELAEAGFKVIVASNGLRALTNLEAGGPSGFTAVITDINLGPGPSGWQIGQRARELNSDVSVIYITGSEGHHWPAKGVRESVLLEKPFSLNQIVSAVLALSNKRAIEVKRMLAS